MTEKFIVRTSAEFESAHAVRNYIEISPGNYIDEPVHGHSFKIEAFVESTKVDERTGFAIDFLTIKQRLDELVNILDHKYINEVGPFDKINPSTENIAKWFFNELLTTVPSGCRLNKVIVWEGPHNYVIYLQSDNSVSYEND